MKIHLPQAWKMLAILIVLSHLPPIYKMRMFNFKMNHATSCRLVAFSVCRFVAPKKLWMSLFCISIPRPTICYHLHSFSWLFVPMCIASPANLWLLRSKILILTTKSWKHFAVLISKLHTQNEKPCNETKSMETGKIWQSWQLYKESHYLGCLPSRNDTILGKKLPIAIPFSNLKWHLTPTNYVVLSSQRCYPTPSFFRGYKTFLMFL